jgi:phage baseplate assembly protein W
MSKEILGKDLRLCNDVLEETLGSDLAISPSGDLEVVSEEHNLSQAIINRLRTREGELADLGHLLYGSRLYELIGQPNNERTRELARLYTRDCIAKDPRVMDIASVTVEVPKTNPSRIDIRITVIPITETTALNIVFPFYLEVT